MVVPERACPKMKNLSSGKKDFASATSSSEIGGISRPVSRWVDLGRLDPSQRAVCLRQALFYGFGISGVFFILLRIVVRRIAGSALIPGWPVCAGWASLTAAIWRIVAAPHWLRRGRRSGNRSFPIARRCLISMTSASLGESFSFQRPTGAALMLLNSLAAPLNIELPAPLGSGPGGRHQGRVPLDLQEILQLLQVFFRRVGQVFIAQDVVPLRAIALAGFRSRPGWSASSWPRRTRRSNPDVCAGKRRSCRAGRAGCGCSAPPATIRRSGAVKYSL